MVYKVIRLTDFILAVVLALSLSLVSNTAGSAQNSEGIIRRLPSMKADQMGSLHPVGLSFSSRSKTFYFIEAQGQTPTVNADVIGITPFADRRGSSRIASTVEDPLNMVFDNQNDRVLVFQPTTGELLDVRENTGGNLDRTSVIRHNVRRLGIQNAKGMTLDEKGGGLFILDEVGPRIVRVQLGPGRNFTGGKVSVINLGTTGLVSPHGLAFDPTTGHLHVLDLVNQRLFELTQSGQVVTTRDLLPFDIKNPESLVFAPSVDQTDDPSQMSLFLADSGLTSAQTQVSGSSSTTQSTGQIVEFSLVAAASLPAGITKLPTTVVHIIDTSKAAWNPSAPDTSGVDYWPLTGRLLVSDSEVDEMSNYFTGKNVYDATLSGTLVSTCSTTNLSRTGFSNEPTGVGINPNNNRIYFSDDDANKINEVSLGPDGLYCTADDGLTTVNVGSLYNIQDAEDVAYGNNNVFIAGGADGEIYTINLGANGVLGGGDDVMTHFDTAALGFTDPEGIGYNSGDGTLLVVSDGSGESYLGVMTTTGTLLRAYNLAYSGLSHREDVTYAPSSQNPAVKNMYVSDRGVDNNTNPSENDGQIWEINIDSSATNTPTATLTNTPSTGPSPTPTYTRTATNTPLPTATSTSTPTFTPTNTPTRTPTATNTSPATATFTPTNTSTPGPSATPTATPTNTPIAGPSFTPTSTNTAIPTFTPTPTAPVSDLIFADGFESGNFSAWTSATTGGGDLSVAAPAALVGSNGMQAVINDATNMYVVDDTPSAETHYRARFYFDPNSIVMADGSAQYIFAGFDTTVAFHVDFRFSAGNYQIRLRQYNNSGGVQSTNWVTISDAPHSIELEWWASTAAGANNGGITLWVDGVQSGGLTGIANDTRRIESVRLGAVSGVDAGTLGTYYIDAFESRRQGYIGP
jgi:hypothetical protein